MVEIADYKTLIVTESMVLQQATDRQKEGLQACVDALAPISEQTGSAGRDEAARHAELTAAVRQIADPGGYHRSRQSPR